MTVDGGHVTDLLVVHDIAVPGGPAVRLGRDTAVDCINITIL
jgi:hypothetical protein